MRPEHIYVFAYDIVRDSDRRRVADLLDEYLARVQQSVFEGRMTRQAAKKLSARVAALMGPDDSLRVYALTLDGLAASFTVGGAPLPEREDFWLL